MTDRPTEVRFARRFTVRRPGHPDLHGIEFPSGRVLADDPYTGLVAAVTVGALTDDDPHATVHWADEPDTTGDPS